MALLKTDDAVIEVPDGSPIKEYAEELGVPFSCRSGVCGTCRIQIIEGSEQLSELNEQEQYFGGLDKNTRLSCQCKILRGEVKIDFESRKESTNVFFRR